jgi:hypothetical protein
MPTIESSSSSLDKMTSAASFLAISPTLSSPRPVLAPVLAVAPSPMKNAAVPPVRRGKIVLSEPIGQTQARRRKAPKLSRRSRIAVASSVGTRNPPALPMPSDCALRIAIPLRSHQSRAALLPNTVARSQCPERS